MREWSLPESVPLLARRYGLSGGDAPRGAALEPGSVGGIPLAVPAMSAYYFGFVARPLRRVANGRSGICGKNRSFDFSGYRIGGHVEESVGVGLLGRSAWGADLSRGTSGTICLELFTTEDTELH